MRLVRVLLWVTAVICIASCQDSNDKPAEPSEQDNTKLVTTDNPIYRQGSMINMQLRMIIEQGDTDKLPDFFPEVENEFMHYFAYYGLFYLHTDKFEQWKYFGKKEVIEIFDEGETGEFSDNFKITTTLSEYPISYTTFYSMDGPNTGTWQSTIAGENFSGRFVYERYHLKGEDPATPRRIEQGIITSQYTGATYDYYASIPRDYAENSEEYPLLLATDAQWNLYPFHDITSSMTPGVFLFSLSEGPYRQRRTDFLLAGIDDYAKFIELELIPFVENNYRVKTENRTLVGASFGGVMVSSMLYKEMERVNNGQSRLFSNFVALDGTHQYEPIIYNQQADDVFMSQLPLPGKLYLAGGEEGLAESVDWYYQSMVARQIPGLEIAHETFPFAHGPMKLPSMEHALKFIYPDLVNPD